MLPPYYSIQKYGYLFFFAWFLFCLVSLFLDYYYTYFFCKVKKNASQKIYSSERRSYALMSDMNMLYETGHCSMAFKIIFDNKLQAPAEFLRRASRECKKSLHRVVHSLNYQVVTVTANAGSTYFHSISLAR